MKVSASITEKFEDMLMDLVEENMEIDHVSVSVNVNFREGVAMVDLYDGDGNRVNVDDGNFDIDLDEFIDNFGKVMGRVNDLPEPEDYEDEDE